MTTEPPYEDLLSPEVSARILKELRSGVDRIRVELDLKRDLFSDFEDLNIDQETARSFIRAFFILLGLLATDEKRHLELLRDLDGLDGICQVLESQSDEEISSLIADLKG